MDATQPMVTVTWSEALTATAGSHTGSLPLTIGRTEADNDIVLPSRVVSAAHARLTWDDGSVRIEDRGSKNGIVVDGRRVTDHKLANGAAFNIGPYTCRVAWVEPATTTDEADAPAADDASLQTQTAFLTPEPPTVVLRPDETPAAAGAGGQHDGNLAFDYETGVLRPLSRPVRAPSGDVAFPPAWFLEAAQVSADRLRATGATEVDYLAVGGGLGSFTWIDHLVIHGVDPSDIAAVGYETKPYGRYRQLCRQSQIPDHERLRSNSDSCPDNIWGWPGYGVREVWHDVRGGRWRNAGRVLWKLFNEPFVETYTPISANVFDSIDREAARIGWEQMARRGRVRAIRQTDDGRFAIAYAAIGAAADKRHRFLIGRHLHLAIGYPGVRFLPDLQAYRAATGDFARVVNAYEDHDAIYETLARHGGVVLVRGRGIVASRIIQRLYEVRRDHGADIGVMHVMRTPLPAGRRYGNAQRQVDNHWEFQPFNWPKAAWGGTLRRLLEEADPTTRAQLLNQWGGTTTADRRDWREIVNQGLREGWYAITFGNVSRVAPDEDGKLATHITTTGAVARETQLRSDFIVDATGLDSALDSSPLLADLVGRYALPLNTQGRLDVANTFELTALRNGNGRAYASGVITLGGPYAAVDSFLGLQYAALRSVDALVDANAPGLRRLNGVRSFSQWLRWARGAQP